MSVSIGRLYVSYHPYERIYRFGIVKREERYRHAKIDENLGKIVGAGYILKKASPWNTVFSGTSSSS